MEEKLKLLEKALMSLRLEVEASSAQNEKIRIFKDERLAKDVNGRVFADRKPNDDAREQLRDTEERRQNQRD